MLHRLKPNQDEETQLDDLELLEKKINKTPKKNRRVRKKKKRRKKHFTF